MAAEERSELWFENRPARGWWPSLRPAELWEFREVAYHLALRDLKLRYKQTVVGVAWVVLQPVIGALIFTLTLGNLIDVPSDGIDYLVFVLAGLVGWTFVSSGTNAAAESLVDNRDLVTKAYFPRILAPIAAVLPGLVDLLPGLVVLAFVMVIHDTAPGVALLTLPLWIIAALGVALGVGLWLGALNALYRDVRYTLGFILQIWLFASPVVFPSSLITGPERTLYAMNPMVGVIDGLRWSLVDGPAPPAADLVSLGAGVAVLLGGIVYFQRAGRQIADRI